MALFQIFNGNEEDLSIDFTKIAFHEGYAYFCKDTGAFYIDVVVNNVNKRVPISSHGLIDDNGDLIDYDQFLQLSDQEILETKLASKAYSNQTLNSNSWDPENRTQTLYLQGLRCGLNETTPPLIICTSGQTDYANILSAVATPAQSSVTNGSIVFTLKSGYSVTGNITLTIIDFG